VTRIRIGSRGSQLALAQANWVKRQIEAHVRDAQVELTVIKTSGDQFVDQPIAAIGGKGVFTKEIEEALLKNDIDLAVHSMKDLPTELPAGLIITAVPKREDARDVLVSRSGQGLKALPRGARLATGSLRRQAQLLHCRRDLAVVAIRGNVDTRLRKLDEGEADALVVAAAGLKRIGREHRISEFLSDEVCVSAVGQGALGIEARADGAVRELLAFLHDADTGAEVAAERALLERLGGGCHVPIGARARVEGETLKMIGAVASPNGITLCKGIIEGRLTIAREIGRRLAEQLIRDGADKILAASGAGGGKTPNL
jgi:hydroxymethylbilane synthase